MRAQKLERRGRRTKDANISIRRGVQVGLRFARRDYPEVEQAARAENRPMSLWARELCLRVAREKKSA